MRRTLSSLITQISPDYFKSILPKVTNSNISIFVGFPKVLLQNMMLNHLKIETLFVPYLFIQFFFYRFLFLQISVLVPYRQEFLSRSESKIEREYNKAATKHNLDRILQINSKDSTLERIKVMILKSSMILWLNLAYSHMILKH